MQITSVTKLYGLKVETDEGQIFILHPSGDWGQIDVTGDNFHRVPADVARALTAAYGQWCQADLSRKPA